MKLVRAAEDDWLLLWDDADERVANARARSTYAVLAARRPTGVVDLIPAARSLLVLGESGFDPRALLALEEAPGPTTTPRRHELPVVPDGADLPAVLTATRLDAATFWARLTGLTFTVGFLGFSPGFPYLYGLPPELHLPRRASPRPAVPAGSVALAGPYAGIYPSVTPGGWNLVGTTYARLFDPAADPPVLLAPGDEVRFVVAR